MSGSVSGITAALPQNNNQLNPLQTLDTIQGIANAQQLNKLYQQELLNKQQELQNLQLTNQTGQANLAWQQRVNAGKALFALNSEDDAGMMRDAPALLESLKADHNMTDAKYAEVQQDIQSGNVKALRTHLGMGLIASMSGPEALQAVVGNTRQVTLPGGQTQTVLDPGPLAPAGTPTRALGSPAGGGMSPEAGANIVTLKDGQGNEHQYTQAQIGLMNLQALGKAGWTQTGGPPIGLGTSGAAPAAAPASPAPGAPAAAPAASSAPATSTPPPAAQQGPAALLGGAVPRQDQITTAANAVNQQQADVLALSQRNYNDEVQSLNSVMRLSASGVDSGILADKFNAVKQALVDWAPAVAEHWGVSVDKSMNQQDMAKMLARLPGVSASDAQMFQKIAGTPNGTMSPVALQRAAGYVLGLMNQDYVTTKAAEERGNAPGGNSPLNRDTQYPHLRSMVNNEIDPNVFRLVANPDPAEYNAYWNSLKNDPAGRAKFVHTYQLMQRYLPTQGSMTPAGQ